MESEGEFEKIDKENERIFKESPRGKFSDFEEYRMKEDRVPVMWMGKVYEVKYKTIGWGRMNRIVADVTKELGSGMTPTDYERLKQERMIKAMVTAIEGTPMDESKWVTIPFDFAEAIRLAFFASTGELVKDMRNANIPKELLELLLKKFGVVDENGNPIEGVRAREEAALKK